MYQGDNLMNNGVIIPSIVYEHFVYNHSGFNPQKGGTERVVDTLSEYFSKDGHSIFYATAHNETKYKAPYPYLVLDEHMI